MVAAGFAAAGCSSSSGGIGSTGELVYRIAEAAFFGEEEVGPQRGSSVKIEREMAAELRYASIGVTIDDNPQFLFVMANQTGAGEMYTLGYKVSVVMRQGRVIRTQGLTQDVLGGRWDGEDIIRTAVTSPGPVAGGRWMDVNERGVRTVEAHCTATSLGDETVTVLEVKIPTRHVREDCKVPALKWAFSNHFWIGADGVIWVSVQHLGPKASPLIIEQFRPAGPPPAAPAG